MRPSCLDCARKHLAEAMVLGDELPEYDGNVEYDHWWAMIGHLGQAASHLKEKQPLIAQRIREVRRSLMELHDKDLRGCYKIFEEVNFNEFIIELNEIAKAELPRT